jgi:hypothetical protein
MISFKTNDEKYRHVLICNIYRLGIAPNEGALHERTGVADTFVAPSAGAIKVTFLGNGDVDGLYPAVTTFVSRSNRALSESIASPIGVPYKTIKGDEK